MAAPVGNGVQSAALVAPDFAPKKLARQLDFTAAGSFSSAEQQQLETKMVLTPPSEKQQQQIQATSRRLPASLYLPPPSPTIALKPVSPKAHKRPAFDVKEGTPKKPRQCNCKNSKCLKLYCECFASGIYCDGCNCVNCYNNKENDAARHEAIELALDRNPNAFRPKMAGSQHAIHGIQEVAGELALVGKPNKGCHCKKTGCLKKYCECFRANILCSENCECADCKNFEGGEERRMVSHAEHGNNVTFARHASDDAITTAIGSSGYVSFPKSKKRKNQELFSGIPLKDPHGQRLVPLPQESYSKTSISTSSFGSAPASSPINSAVLRSSKVTLRPVLADIVQPDDAKELCKLLVVVSGQAAKRFTEKRGSKEKTVEREDQIETSLASSTQGRDNFQNEMNLQKASVDFPSEIPEEGTSIEESRLDFEDVQIGRRPMSPATQALMCDEQETIFMASTTQNSGVSSQLPCNQRLLDFHVEQERRILVQFCNCLQKIVTYGRMKEEKFASMASQF